MTEMTEEIFFANFVSHNISPKLIVRSRYVEGSFQTWIMKRVGDLEILRRLEKKVARLLVSSHPNDPHLILVLDEKWSEELSKIAEMYMEWVPKGKNVIVKIHNE